MSRFDANWTQVSRQRQNHSRRYIEVRLEDSTVNLQPRRPILNSILLLCCLGVCSCVSVSLPKGEPRRSQDYRVKDPGAPFVSHKAELVDRAWKNPANGSIISVVSECSETADPPLSTLRDDIVRSLSETQVESEKSLSYQAREALRSLVRGKVDGVESLVDLLVFKKNGCAYVLTLITTRPGLASDQPRFDRFLGGFEAP
jgi:hypothetical protein